MARRSANMKRVLGRLFRERQIYHRSDGVVHFISMSSRTQIALASVLFGALLWVAYASVNVIFKEQIIVAKERDFRVMQTTLNARLQSKESAYEEILALNLVQRENFEDAMRELAGRHQALEAVIAQKSMIDERLQALSDGLSIMGAPGGRRLGAANRLMVDPDGREPTPRASRTDVLRRESSADLSGERSAEAVGQIQRHAAMLRSEQIDLLRRIEEDSVRRIAEIEAIIDETGVSAASLVARTKIDGSRLAQGGPFVSLADAEQFASSAVADEKSLEFFFKQSYRVASVLDQLTLYDQALHSVPLSSPLAVRHYVSSVYGPRRDPINGRSAMHEGLDLAAPWGSPVLATAPGKIVYAGMRSGYGLMIEIDHGNGFSTRYGHLSKISVRRGVQVDLNQEIGKLGSSGRVTGPHVHYEVYYKGVTRNPTNFVKAGRYVFES